VAINEGLGDIDGALIFVGRDGFIGFEVPVAVDQVGSVIDLLVRD
jgi:hypothetical protein